MSKAGRPLLPVRIKKLSGTLRKDRIRGGVDFDLINKVPESEDWLDEEAKKYFKNICELLISKQLLNVANVQLVIIMAQEFSKYETASKELNKKDAYVITTASGYKQPSPWIAIQNTAQKNYRDIAGLFGLDPMSSQKIGIAKKGDTDDFDEFMKSYDTLS